MKFYLGNTRIFVSSLKSLRTKLRNNTPILNEKGENVIGSLVKG